MIDTKQFAIDPIGQKWHGRKYITVTNTIKSQKTPKRHTLHFCPLLLILTGQRVYPDFKNR